MRAGNRFVCATSTRCTRPAVWSSVTRVTNAIGTIVIRRGRRAEIRTVFAFRIVTDIFFVIVRITKITIDAVDT